MRRRALLAALSLPALASGALSSGALAQATTTLEVWKDPDCGCCGGWVDRMAVAGFRPTVRAVPAVGPYRRMLGVPPDLLSCHVARVGGFALEGHVPPAAVLRLLAERPAGVRGLAVPGMPVGSPGMEVEGQEPETFDVIAFLADGTSRPWMRFRGAQPA